MWDEIGKKTNLRFHIGTPDDNRHTKHVAKMSIYCDYDVDTRRYHNFQSYPRAFNNRDRYGDRQNEPGPRTQEKQYDIHIDLKRSHKHGDPLILGISQILQRLLGWGGRGWNSAPKEFKVGFHLPTSGLGWSITKGPVYYKLNDIRIKKKQLLTVVSRVLYRSCFEEDPKTLIKYMYRMINLPENVTYALENRTPYWFYTEVDDTLKKMEVRLNTKLISNDECALEISDGIWAPITTKDLDIFMNYYYHNHSRTENWKALSPKKLWWKLMDSPPNSSQHKLMKEFLIQNRTHQLVEDRAKELMKSMVVKYPDRIRLIELADNTVMLIRGKICDWVIIDSTYKSNIQKVKTFVYIDSKFEVNESHVRTSQNFDFEDGKLRGPICIDNIHTNSSVGDQYVARALALLNDKQTIELVSTIARYIPNSLTKPVEFDGTQLESRFNFKELDESSNWSVII